MNEYRRATYEEKEEFGCCETYDLLIGPNDFECLLTEPEDRNWFRDGKDVIKELNRLHQYVHVMSARLKELEEVIINDDGTIRWSSSGEEIGS